ncbi:MAG: archaetidylserine decarboxylase [Puniceicoccales bacterium]|jgi:phosphatidylserine decarboxylase|nr:archaetidylserine decarboxylase [Puniceicoccales bacterium]
MDTIRFYNRYSQAVEEEPIYGERLLRWLYQRPFGNFCERRFLSRKIFSSCIGWWMRRSWTRKYIDGFVEKYKINADIFEKKPSGYRSFDEFFSRRIKREFRPIAAKEDQLIFPCDGRHFVIESLQKIPYFFVKGQVFQLGSFLRDEALEKQFCDGSMLISRLSPVDYHRFHFPCDALTETTYCIFGRYASVNPIAIRDRIAVFWENKRMKTSLHHDLGDVLMIEIGATCIGSIEQTFHFNAKHLKGTEKGYFHFGGSTVVLLFEKGKIRFAQDLVKNSRAGMETYAFMGDEMATWA